jgi:hypothetical protein
VIWPVIGVAALVGALAGAAVVVLASPVAGPALLAVGQGALVLAHESIRERYYTRG